MPVATKAYVDSARKHADDNFTTSQSNAAAGIMQRLSYGNENMVITVFGDSTGVVPAVNTGWVYKFCVFLAGLYPAYTVNMRNWNDGSQVYDAATVIQTGTGTGNAGGPFVLDLYNGSVSGSVVTYPIATYARWNLMAAVTPNLVIMNYAHNSTAATTGYGATHYLLCRAVQAAFPKCGIIQTVQNPRSVTTSGEGANHLIRLREVYDLARDEGYGVINVAPKFLADPNYATDYMNVDAVHPNLAGVDSLWMPTIKSHFMFSSDLTPLSQVATDTRIWIPAYLFGAYSGAPVLALTNSDKRTWAMPTGADTEIEAEFIIPSNWNNFDLYIYWQAAAFNANNKVAWRTLTRARGLGPTTAGLDTATYASLGWTNNQAGSVVSGVSNVGAYANCVRQMLTNTALNSGPYGLRVKRVGTDAANDNFAADALFSGVEFVRSR